MSSSVTSNASPTMRAEYGMESSRQSRQTDNQSIKQSICRKRKEEKERIERAMSSSDRPDQTRPDKSCHVMLRELVHRLILVCICLV